MSRSGSFLVGAVVDEVVGRSRGTVTGAQEWSHDETSVE